MKFENREPEQEAPCDQFGSWDLLKLKAPEKKITVSQSLSDIINTACTSQCIADSIVEKYKIPNNCNKHCSR